MTGLATAGDGSRRTVFRLFREHKSMKSRVSHGLALVAIAAALVGCSSSAATPTPTSAPATAAATAAATTAATAAATAATSTTITLPTGGTFTISPRIVAKIANKETLNFVNSYPYITIAGASAQMQAGAEQAAADIEKKYGVKISTKVIGVANPDAPTQIGQITSGLNANQYDCLSVDPNPPGAFTNTIKTAMDAGVPVFTVNGDTETSARIATSMADDNGEMDSPLQMGRIAANYAIKWATDNSQTFDGKKVALITGDATAPWAQGRLKGFIDTLKAKYPTVTFSSTYDNAYMVGFDTATVLSKVQSYWEGHKDTFFFYSSDWGGVQIGQVIQRNNLKGKVFGLGFNLNAAYVQLLKDDYLIGTIDQRYDLQAKNWAMMCADLLFDHKAPASQYNWVTPNIWSAKNIQEALDLYSKIPNSGVTGS